MSEENGIDRRSFVKATGAVAGVSLVGLGAGSTVAGDEGIDRRFLNWRTVEAQKVWDRGYRGRPDRTLVVTDTGIDARHPDLGPWNGVRGEVVDGSLQLARDPDGYDPDPTESRTTLATITRSGTIGPGAFAPAPTSRTETTPFVPNDVEDDDGDDGTVNEVDATMTWTPPEVEGQSEDIELYLEVEESDGSWTRIAQSTNPGQPEHIRTTVENDRTYRFVVETWANVFAQFEIEIDLNEVTVEGIDEDPGTLVPYDELDPFADVDPSTVTADTPKTVGWIDPGGRFGSHDEPSDPNDHGTHVSGIMAGTGRASTIDRSNTEVHRPHAVLLPGDFIEYEVMAEAGTTVFASAFGENVVVEIVHDDEVVHESPLRLDSIIADEPTVHPSGAEEYTIRARPARTQPTAVQGVPVPTRAESGNPTVGRLNEIVVGTYEPPAGTVGDRLPDDGQAVHSGLAPNASLLGMQGFGTPTGVLAEQVDAIAEAFNARAVNMSYGYPYGIPFGAAGGRTDPLPAQLKQIAQGGVLPVAAAGNFPTPANGNGAPNGMDEPISVVATGPLDGITTYSAGGIGTVDEDDDEGGNGFDRKPDVTAPGGDLEPDFLSYAAGVDAPVPSYYELVRAAKAEDPGEEFATDDPPRDFLSSGGTSMASPYVCGTVGLLAQAMEEDAPASIALPEPTAAGFDDAMRLKQVVLATASETAFTAAPYHSAKSPPHPPTYDFGGRDPYEGYGRVNPDAAVDAVTRELVDTSAPGPGESVDVAFEEKVGLYVPEDSRAVAGYVDAPGGSFDVSLDFGYYSGGNKGMAKENPHLDLFVYDAEEPAENGEPNIVSRGQARQGAASVSVSAPDDGKTYFVVAKLVNVPGAVNGFDVGVHFDLSVSYTAPELPAFTASGSRADDGAAFTAGQTDTITITLDGFAAVVDAVTVTDTIPASWSHLDGDGAPAGTTDGRTTIDFGEVTRDQVAGDASVSFEYYVEVPDSTGQYTLGPATAEVVGDASEFRTSVAEFGGTDTNTVVGVSTNLDQAAGSATDETSTTGDAGDSVTSATDSL